MAKLSSLFLGKDEKKTAGETDNTEEEQDKRYSLLFVDDEENVLNAMKRLFRRENYRIFLARGADEGFAVLEKM
jgi:response regulator RpfG family c-di-GMP phosphodiesterase